MDLSITISATGSKFAPLVLQGDYVTQIKNAAQIGYPAVELHIRDPKAIDRLAVIQALNRDGLRVSAIGTGQAFVDDKLYFTSFETDIRQAAIQRIKGQIDLAAELNTKVIIGTIKGRLPEDRTEREKARIRAVDCLKECLEHAEKGRVCLTLEAINRYETNFLNSAAETIALIREIDSPLLGLHLDTFHMNIEEVSLTETLELSAKYLSYLHVADSNRWRPGKGHLDFRSLFSTFKKIGYQGFLGVECLPLPDSQSAAEEALEYLTGLLTD